MRRKKSETLQNLENLPGFKTAWAKRCVFCPDFVAQVRGTPPAEPLSIGQFDHLTTPGVTRFCAFWKVCEKHEAEMLEQAKAAEAVADRAPF